MLSLKVGRRRQFLDNLETGYISSPELPFFSADPYQVDPLGFSRGAPLKPCLKTPSDLNMGRNRSYQLGRQVSTPSAFQPFSTIVEDSEWNPYMDSAKYMNVNQSFPTKNTHRPRNSNPTQFRSEISRFTESLYNLAKPLPVKPKGHFPRVEEKYPKLGNPCSILNPGLPMKPVQNLDQINPFTGLPNVQFVPTMEYFNRRQSTYLPDWTPSPDTTARRVAAILEPQNTYADLVHSFQKKQVEQAKLHSIEQKFRSMSLQNLQQIDPIGVPTNMFNVPGTIDPIYDKTAHDPRYLHQQNPLFHPQFNNSYLHNSVSNIQDPTFLDRPVFHQQENMNMIQNSIQNPIQNPINNPLQHNLPLSNIDFDQTQLDHAWLQLSTELQLKNNMTTQNMSKIPGPLPSMPVHHHPPLQGVLDMMGINGNNQNIELQNKPRDLHQNKSPGLFYHKNDLYLSGGFKKEKFNASLDTTYDSLLNLPKMPKSPSEVEPINSSEDELTRYNVTNKEVRDSGNIHMKQFQLSAKYQESKYIENSILGHVPSVLQDLGKVDLEKKLNDKSKQIDKTLRQISRAYEDRCKQRQKMRSALSLLKDIPKMELDEHNNIVTKEDTTKLKEIRQGKNGNTIKLDNMEIEVSNEIMSMIYHRALKKRMERKSSKCRPVERRRSKPRINEKSHDSSDTETEISEFMKNALLKQQLENTVPDTSREMKIRSLQRYSPRLKNPLIPVFEGESDETKNEDEIDKQDKEPLTPILSKLEIPTSFSLWEETDKNSPCKFLDSDEPVPPPAPEIRINDMINQVQESKPKHQKSMREKNEKKEVVNDHPKKSKPIPVDNLRKTKSSGAFNNLPDCGYKSQNVKQTVKRQTSDPSEKRSSIIFEDKIIDCRKEETKNKNLNISETARKHLGMGDKSKNSPEEGMGTRNRINSIFQTIGSSYEDPEDSNKKEKNCSAFLTEDVANMSESISKLRLEVMSKGSLEDENIINEMKRVQSLNISLEGDELANEEQNACIDVLSERLDNYPIEEEDEANLETKSYDCTTEKLGLHE